MRSERLRVMESVSWRVYETVIEHIGRQAYRQIESQVEWHVSENVSEQGLEGVEYQVQDKVREDLEL